MNNLSIIGISRGNEFSPNHVDNDAAIFRAVAEELTRHGYTVELMTETEFVTRRPRAKLFFNMVRSRAAIELLKEYERQGALVVNSAFGIDNCVRRPMTELLIAHQVPYPESQVLATDAPFAIHSYPCWIKRGDSHALVKDDVCYVTTPDEAEQVRADFARRGISNAVINRHLVGDLIKFYGVQGTDFFYWFYPSDPSKCKFGLEVINGPARGIPFEVDQLRAHSHHAAEVLNVPVYGGDCVITPEGGMYLIDFNDWPSFARCRQEAAPHIAACIHARVQHYLQDKNKEQ
jgi:hypothetical protein